MKARGENGRIFLLALILPHTMNIKFHQCCIIGVRAYVIIPISRFHNASTVSICKPNDASDIEQITQQRYLVDQTHPTMYRSVAHTSQVDESLFGKDSGRNGTMTKGRRTVTGPLAPSSIVISADELNRIRVSSA